MKNLNRPWAAHAIMSDSISAIGTSTNVAPLQRSQPVYSRGKSEVYDLKSALSRNGFMAKRAAAQQREELDPQALAQQRAYQEAGRRMRSGLNLDPEETQNAGLFLNPGSAGLPSGAADARLPENRPLPGDPAPQSLDSNENASASADKGAGRAGNTGSDEVRGPERSFMGSASGGSDAEGKAASAEDGDTEGVAGQKLDEQEQAEVSELKKRDQEVRTHEQAHISAGSGLVSGGASYQRERGPDGNMYAVGGEVSIDTSEGSTPDETIAKARRIKAAALAPAEPSGQDRQVAAQAAQMEAQARTEKSSGDDERSPTESGAQDERNEGPSQAGEKKTEGPLSSALDEVRPTREGASGNAVANGMSRRANLSYQRAAAERAPFTHRMFSQAV